jgi:hypothetical protein
MYKSSLPTHDHARKRKRRILSLFFFFASRHEVHDASNKFNGPLTIVRAEIQLAVADTDRQHINLYVPSIMSLGPGGGDTTSEPRHPGARREKKVMMMMMIKTKDDDERIRG